jgi:uncharacterized protein
LLSAGLKFLGVIGAFYALMVAGLYFFQRSVIYHPSSGTQSPEQVGLPNMSSVKIKTEDGLSLLAWWFRPSSDDKPVIAFFHGNAGSIGYRSFKVRPLLDRGYGVLLLAYRGYSGNSGNPTEQGLYADARGAMKFLDEKGIPEKRRVFYGESLGTGIAVYLASKGHGGAIILESPYTSIADVAAARFPIFPVRALVKDRFDSLSRIGRVDIPLLVIHGELDNVVKAKFGKRLFGTANEPKEAMFIKAAGHIDLYKHGAGHRIIQFIEKYF